MSWIIKNSLGQTITETVISMLAYDIAAERGEDVFVTDLVDPSRRAVSPVYHVLTN